MEEGFKKTDNIGQNLTLFNNIGWFFTISDNIWQYQEMFNCLTLFEDMEQYLNVHYEHPLTIPYKVRKIWQYFTILVDILQY